MKPQNIVIFGATGSIGSSVLSIIEKNQKKLKIEAITCNRNLAKLLKIAKKFKVKKIGYNIRNVKKIKNYNLKNYNITEDISCFDQLISSKTNIIIFAISGLEPLRLLSEILKKGKTVGLANKECIISFGEKLINLAKKNSSNIIPLDSEHNSIHHLLNNYMEKFKSITITASGGPFYKLKHTELKNITPADALKHPVWNMGKKISIDSSTMMNKALEIIEAKNLFNLKNNQVNALIHPQSVIHAMVNYNNGTSIALLHRPDMKIPISSLFYGFAGYMKKNNELNLDKISKLDFFPMNEKRFPAIKLAKQVMKEGGLAPHVFNYLNEKLVNSFLNRKINFTQIVELNEKNLELVFKSNNNKIYLNIDDIYDINHWIDENIYIGD